MKMKTKYFFMLLVVCFMGIQGISAQKNDPDKRPRKRMSIEQVIDRQANFISEKLGLDDKTSARFKGIYKKYRLESFDLLRKNMPNKPDVKSDEGKMPPVPTDAQVDEMMRSKFKIGHKLLDIREKYYDEFRKFLSAKQVEKVYDEGEMNRGKFHQEMNRRAGMKKPGDGKRPPVEGPIRDE